MSKDTRVQTVQEKRWGMLTISEKVKHPPPKKKKKIGAEITQY